MRYCFKNPRDHSRVAHTISSSTQGAEASLVYILRSRPAKAYITRPCLKTPKINNPRKSLCLTLHALNSRNSGISLWFPTVWQTYQVLGQGDTVRPCLKRRKSKEEKIMLSVYEVNICRNPTNPENTKKLKWVWCDSFFFKENHLDFPI